jgi:glycosyltransferase involved in cell wall biosynthesis
VLSTIGTVFAPGVAGWSMTFLDPRTTAGDNPAVSVIVPAYNAARTIDTALQSVFAQTYRDYEVIVVDDGSTDATAEVVCTWGDAVTFRRQPNSGPASARNHAIECARGRLLAFLDADDVWLPTKLERQVAYFERYPATGLLHTDALVSREPLSVLFEGVEDVGGELTPPTDQFCALFHCDHFVQTLTAMAPRDVVLDVGLFDPRREFHVEDWDLWLRIAAKHPVGYLPARLAVYRPDGGMSSKVEKTFRGQSLVIDKALPLCASSCAKHRDNPDVCLSDRRHLLYWQLGYERFRRGQQAQAREAFKKAWRTKPQDTRALGYVFASYAGRSVLEPLRDLSSAIRCRRTTQQPETVPDRRLSAPDLLQDTAFRRARMVLPRALHALDDRLRRGTRGERRRVLFEAASPLSMAVFQPIYKRLQEDGRLEFWFTANDQAWDAGAIFDAAGMSERVVTPDQIRWKKFDLYINTDFWNTTWLPRRTRRVHLFHGVAGKYGLDAPTEIAPLIATFDRLMFANLDRLKRYVEAGVVDPESPQAALIGYPKVDCLVDGSLDRQRILSHLGLHPEVPTVLYAPTWSPHSSLAFSGEALVKALASLDVNVIIKLHDRSLDKTERGSGGIDWGRRFGQLCRGPRMHLAEDSDVCRYLCAADLLITDHSSVGFEFMLLDRPIVLLDAPDLLRHGQINPQKVDLLRSAAYLVRSLDTVTATVASALADPRRHSVQRRTIANELFYRPGTATTRAVQCIYDVIGLPMRAAAPQEAVASSVQLELGARRS